MKTNPNDMIHSFSGESYSNRAGLIKREYFAAAALQGLVANKPGMELQDLSKSVVEFADALIDELNVVTDTIVLQEKFDLALKALDRIVMSPGATTFDSLKTIQEYYKSIAKDVLLKIRGYK